MKVLIGTDILLSYLKKKDMVDGISLLFRWLTLTKSSWYIDIASISVLTHFVPINDLANLKGFQILKHIWPKSTLMNHLIEIQKNSRNVGPELMALLPQLNYLRFNDVDFLITENQTTHQLSRLFKVDERVLTIEEFIEECSVDFAEFDDSKGVVIKMVKFGTLDINDAFFNSFKEEYDPYYHIWFKKKAADDVYIAQDEMGRLRGLLKLKVENYDEDYGDIVPLLKPKKRLKISSFKADYTGQKLGERFMRIVFETALREHVEEIYITLYPTSRQRKRLVGMISQWGFFYYGVKDGSERVYVRSFEKRMKDDAKACYPFHSTRNGVFIIPIYYGYAMLLLPPFMNNNYEIDNSKQAIKKVLILHEMHQHLQKGAVLVFMQKKHQEVKSELVAIGVVENVYCSFCKEEDFINRCRKRSVLSKDLLHQFWHRADENPVVVEFLYMYHFDIPIQVNPIELCNSRNMIRNQCPVEISRNSFFELFAHSTYEKNLVVD